VKIFQKEKPILEKDRPKKRKEKLVVRLGDIFKEELGKAAMKICDKIAKM